MLALSKWRCSRSRTRSPSRRSTSACSATAQDHPRVSQPRLTATAPICASPQAAAVAVVPPRSCGVHPQLLLWLPLHLPQTTRGWRGCVRRSVLLVSMEEALRRRRALPGLGSRLGGGRSWRRSRFSLPGSRGLCLTGTWCTGSLPRSVVAPALLLCLTSAALIYVRLCARGVLGRLLTSSAEERCNGGTLNLLFCGIVWSVGILSACCHSCLQSELDVRDWFLECWLDPSSTLSFSSR